MKTLIVLLCMIVAVAYCESEQCLLCQNMVKDAKEEFNNNFSSVTTEQAIVSV